MIYVTGDMHGEEERLYSRSMKKLSEGDTLIVCGDFGFVWDGSAKEKKILEYLGSRKYNVCFIDGTHENFDLLEKCRMTVWNGGKVRRVSGNLFHMMRGQIFTIEGYRIFTFGGGESTDREMRTEHVSWWKEEMPTPAELEEGAKAIDEVDCDVDFIITHEPPSIVKSTMLLRAGETDSVNKLNGYFEQLNRVCKFKHWYFGSMHEDRIITNVHTAVFEDVIPINSDMMF